MKGYVLSKAAVADLDDIWPGVFKLAVNSHFLFYRVLEDGRTGIVRILHKRMNVEARLGETPLH